MTAINIPAAKAVITGVSGHSRLFPEGREADECRLFFTRQGKNQPPAEKFFGFIFPPRHAMGRNLRMNPVPFRAAGYGPLDLPPGPDNPQWTSFLEDM